MRWTKIKLGRLKQVNHVNHYNTNPNGFQSEPLTIARSCCSGQSLSAISPATDGRSGTLGSLPPRLGCDTLCRCRGGPPSLFCGSRTDAAAVFRFGACVAEPDRQLDAQNDALHGWDHTRQAAEPGSFGLLAIKSGSIAEPHSGYC